MEDTKKCAHPSCMCNSPTDSEYCSAYCSGQAETSDILCSCGHEACTDAAAARLPGREVSEPVYVEGADGVMVAGE
jgi:hypothetical protein